MTNLSKHRVKRSMSNISRFGIDLAKNSFPVSGLDEHGKIALQNTLSALGYSSSSPTSRASR